MTMPRYQKLDFSAKRRVLPVGDIHGEFIKLSDELLRVDFDPKLDVLVSVGDLVDRGPYSYQFENWINQDWFYRVRGNHDDQPREYLLGYEPEYNVRRNGGEWFLDKDRPEQERIASLLEDAPLALEIITPAGHRIGVTHADMGNKWQWILDNHDNPRQERNMVNACTGSREIINRVLAWPDIEPNEVEMKGIDHVFHGHTPVDKPITVSNRTWLDTGACFQGGFLTIVDADAWLKKLTV